MAEKKETVKAWTVQEGKKISEIKHPKIFEYLYLKKQLQTFDSYKAMMAARTQSPEEYQKLREAWQKNKEEVANFEGGLSQEQMDDYAENVNRSEKLVKERFIQVDKELKELKARGEVLLEKVSPEESEPDKKVETQVNVKENWKFLWALGPGDKLPKDVTEADVKKHIEMVGKSQGKETLAYAYAKSLLENLREAPVRDEAETHRDEVKELEEQEKQLKKDLQEEKNKEVGVFDAPNDAEVSKIEKRVKEKEGQIEEKKEKLSWGEKFKKGVRGFFDKFKKENKKEEKAIKKTEEAVTDNRTPEEKIASGEEYLDESGFIHNQKEGKGYKKVSGFLAERAKGFVGGFGWWESHQAEKFRLGTKEAGVDSKAQAQLIEQEEGLLNFDDAWDEAHEVEEKRAKEEKVFTKDYGLTEKEARYAAVMWLSDKISKRKKEYNQKIEDKIVALALVKLEQKIGGKEWFEAYKAANGGRALTPEKAAELEEKVREKIGELRKGQSKKDLVDFTKLARQSLDKNWWHRYIYTGLDAVLAGLMLKWVVGKYLGGKAVAGAEKIAAKGAGKAVESGGETGLKDTIWGEAKRMLIKDGIANPTNIQIQQVATEIAKDSGVKVITKSTGEVIWQATKAGAKGVDIALQKGFLLKLGGAVKKIAMIKMAL